jgi:predicted ATP-dependent endonuclease of OLD family
MNNVNESEIKIFKNDGNNILSTRAKKDLKKSIKNFAIYQVYKVINPKRIAGETKKDNYVNNLMHGGQKLASKYEGGKSADLKQYGRAEVARIKSMARASKGGFRGR